MQKNMAVLTEELHRQSAHSNAFNQLQQGLKGQKILMNLPVNEGDMYFIFQTFKTYFPAGSNSDTEFLMENITLLCEMLANSQELMKIAPLFIYQIVSKHKSRLCSAGNFSFALPKLWTYKPYQIKTDNGKNFDNMIALLNFFLELCNHFGKNPVADIDLSRYIFSELSNLCEWYHTHFEYDETINLPVPLAVMIGQCCINCCGDGSSYSCLDDEIEDFFSHKKSSSKQMECKIEQYLITHPEVIQQYIDNLSASSDKRRHMVYQILDSMELPAKDMTPGHLPLIYSVINILLDREVNQQTEKVLLEIGKKLTNSCLSSF